MAYDLVIRNGTIIDGSGAPAFGGDVAIQGDRIAEVGRVSGKARRVIDAKGVVIAPGFIDIHTHYDAQVLWDPLMTSSCWHGVTTAVMGNCGFSIAPCKPEDRDYIMRMLARVEGISLGAMQQGPSWDFVTFADYMDRIGGRLGLNIACQIGHSTVRRYVMGEDATSGEATDVETAQMKAVVREAMERGVVGFSTGRGNAHIDWEGRPVPSRWATVKETHALATALGEFGFGVVETIPKSGFALDQEDQDEITLLSRSTGRNLSWNQFAQAVSDTEGRWKRVLEFHERAHGDGLRIYGVCNCRPTGIDFDLPTNNIALTTLPEWREVLLNPRPEITRLLSDPGYRDRMRPGIDDAWAKGSIRWDSIAVSYPKRQEHQALKGMTLRELGKRAGKHPLDAMLDLALSEDLETEFTAEGTRNTDPHAVAEIIKSPYSILGISDAGAHVNALAGAEYSTQVLAKWVREKRVLTLEQAVYKLSLMPAMYMGFTDRGLLKAGMAADVIVFDPDTVQPLPKEKTPDLPNGETRITIKAKGIHHTIVNGAPLMEGGEHTGAYPGRLIRSTDYTRAPTAK